MPIKDSLGGEEFDFEEFKNDLAEVITELSTGLKGPDRAEYLTSSDLAQNTWFQVGVGEKLGEYRILVLLAQAEDSFYFDIGDEDEVHELAADRDKITDLAKSFVEDLEEMFSDDYDPDAEDEEEENTPFDDDEEL